MYRITAINEDTDVEDEDENQVTKEAEETIVVSEYTRALKFKKEKRIDNALSLLSELLQTRVLDEIPKSQSAKTLQSIKYNCYKNIGLIYESKGDTEKALEFLIKAIELDDNDVYTMNKLGQLALSIKQLDVAQMAFEKCLNKNPNHWPSGDGMLQILCQRENYNEAYGWALLWYDKNPNYERGLEVILEIREKFHGLGLEYIENCWSIKFKNKTLKRTISRSVFPDSSFDTPDVRAQPNIDQFKIDSFDNLNWLTFGKLIADMYTHFSDAQNILALGYEFTTTDFLLNKCEPVSITSNVNEEECSVTDSETDLNQENADDKDVPMDAKQENSISNPGSGKPVIPNPDGGNSADASADDSDAPTTAKDSSGSEAVSKPKQSRRRGSDLQFLEQWCYWDRNRKYSQRQKNKQNERNDVDATIKGILKKILPKYFEENFDNESPFHPSNEPTSLSDETTENESQLDSELNACDKFQENTDDVFNKFMDVTKKSKFSIITLVMKWLQCISKCWEKAMPKEVIELYIKLYRFYLNHYDLCTWNLLDENDFQAAFRMTLFYLELSHERSLSTANTNTKNEIDPDWYMLFNHLIFHSGFYEYAADEVETLKYQKRLYWLQFCLARYEYDLRRSVNCLESIRELLAAHDASYKLVLPNQTQNNKIDLETVDALIVSLERTISLNNVRQLYIDRKYDELIPILKDSLINTTTTNRTENAVMKVSTQFEVFLECFWNLEMFDECFVWSERCLKYAIDCFLVAAKDSEARTEWAENVTFILTYIEALILNEGYLIVSALAKYYSRLIQSIVRIVSHQLDTVQDKNNNQLHPIDTKMPWVILHHILQREEDMTGQLKRKMSIDSNASHESNEEEEEEEEEEETEGGIETIPKSIMIFFTAHEYLGTRGWCTKDQGKLLLYTLEVIVPRLRTPYLEPFRDIIAEYLEQVTYCLYGYPAKRARLKHIEDHDSQNVELTWDHAIQLFDLYRPDELPEFDSYKNDSITSEMEQLLQRIIAIIPPDIDPSLRATEMEKFISGESTEYPKALDILPYRINSVFYLLADHYFKNRDFVKSAKYYMLDLSNFPSRFDAWAGLALSKASILETKLNACTTFSTKEWIQQSEEVLRCFEQCLKIDGQTILLWIEYGNYAYALHSYCSRCLKQSSDTLSMERFAFLEERKEQCLKIAYDCFTTADQSKVSLSDDNEKSKKTDDDEKWLYHYMLGKVAEKRKEPPNVVIDHYLKSAQYLYEHNATYPFKISFTSPQNLSLEALEIFYRITAAIVKYVEQHSTITRGIGKYFVKVLKQQASSPFAMSQAKINENSINAFKRKLSLANEEAAKQKLAKMDTNATASTNSLANANLVVADCEAIAPKSSTPPANEQKDNIATDTNAKAASPSQTLPEKIEPMEIIETVEEKPTIDNQTKQTEISPDKPIDHVSEQPLIIENATGDEKVNSPVRRGSQESTATTTTQTTTTTSTDSTSSSSSDSSSSESSTSDSDDSSSDDDGNKDENAPCSEKQIENIYKLCIKNLEECVTRFPEHYKSIYRLVLIYMNGPERIKDLKRCNQLLLGTYTTALSNQIQGLFSDRKNNNLFNGIWRNPSSEIDRPGSFSSHLSKCVNILLQILRKYADHKLLLEIVFHLQRIPEVDKRYIKDSERKELLEQAMSFCAQSFKDLLKQHSADKRDDGELLSLIVEIYKAHKKCLKNMTQKESIFSNLMIDTYKMYIQGKVDRLPDNVNYLDLAVKLCVYEINAKKNLDKQLGAKRYSLDELGFGGLATSSFKANALYTGVSSVTSSAAILPFISANTQITAKPLSVGSANFTSATTSTATATATTTASASASASSSSSSISTSTFIPGLSRPRGRPPGSKNINHSLITPPSTMPNFNPLVGNLDPTTMSTILSLFANPEFMANLARFQDPTSMNTFLTEYFRLSNLGNMAQVMAGFTRNLNYLTSSFGQTTSISTASSSQAKIPKMETNTASKFSSMSIFPTYTNKPPASSSTLPSMNSNVSAAVITKQTNQIAISTSSNVLKPVASTVISVGSGQLTITPSISITPHTPQASVMATHMQSTSFNPQKPKRSTDNKRKTNNSPALKLPPKVYPDLPTNLPLDLPKSLSITPTPNAFTSKQTSQSKPYANIPPEKVIKQNKPKKKSMDALNIAKKATSAAHLGTSDFNQQMQSALINQYQELMRSGRSSGPNFLSQFEQFLSVPTSMQNSLLSKPAKPSKSSIVTGTVANAQIGMISVKQLELLQETKSLKSIQKSTQKASAQQTFSLPNISTKGLPIVSSSGLNLNPYATAIPSLAHSSQQMSYLPSMPPASIPSNLQSSPTKTLQQKLSERQKQLNDANQQQQSVSISRPSSTSSAGSSKTRKSENDVIVLD